MHDIREGTVVESIQIVRKSDGVASTVKSGNVVLDQPASVKLGMDPQAVERFERVGNDLHLVLKDGTSINIDGFFAADTTGQSSELLMQDAAGTVWHGEPTQPWTGFHFTEIPAEATTAPAAAAASGGMPTWAMTVLGIAGAGGLAAAAGGGGGGDSPAPASPPPPSPPPPPPAPTIAVTGIEHARVPAEGDQATVVLHGTSNGQFVIVRWEGLDGSTSTSNVVQVANGAWSLEIPRDHLHEGHAAFIATITDAAGHPVLTNGAEVSATADAVIEYPNNAPTIDLVLVTSEDSPLQGLLSGYDADGHPLTYTVIAAPSHGTVVVDSVATNYRYTPDPDFNGKDSFILLVEDGHGGSVQYIVPITVNPVNDAPVAAEQFLTTDEDTTLAGQIIAHDIDGDTSKFSIFFTPGGGSVALDPNTGAFVYTPGTHFNGEDNFVVTVADQAGGVAYTTIQVHVEPVNDLPEADDLYLSVQEDLSIDHRFLRATDVDSATFSYAIASAPAHGTVTLDPATGIFGYVPVANFSGTDQFLLEINDGDGGVITRTVHIEVVPVNDVAPDSAQHLTTDEDTPLSGTVQTTDLDGDTLTYTLSTAVGSPWAGTVTLDAQTGAFVYVPHSNAVGQDVFVVMIDDGHGGQTQANVFILINPINDAPIAANLQLTTSIDAPVSGAIAATDVEYGALSYALDSIPAHGVVTLNPATGAFVYTPGGGYSGSDAFVVLVSDGDGGKTRATVDIGVLDNHLPVASTDSISVAEGGIATTLIGGATSVLTNDSDAENDPLVAVLVSGPTHGSLTLSPNGTFSYVHDGSESSTDGFTYRAHDGTAAGNLVTVSIAVAPVNDAPAAADDSYLVESNGSLTAIGTGLLANDSDAEANTLAAILVSGPSHGTLTLNSNGSFSYQHDGSATSTDSFTYVANDGTANSNVATVHLSIPPFNDWPVAMPDYVTTTEGTPVVIPILANDYDPDGDRLSLTALTAMSGGSLSLDVFTYEVTFTPNEGFVGQGLFSYTISDDHGHSTGAFVEVTVTAAPGFTSAASVDASPFAFDSQTLFDRSVESDQRDTASTALLPGLQDVLSTDTRSASTDTFAAWLDGNASAVGGTPASKLASATADVHWVAPSQPLDDLHSAHSLLQA
ncbi:MAG TPA: Ig-like domain-containing protein [Stenotrophomonas sp.]|jgi:VCBS repeat-containing protein